MYYPEITCQTDRVGMGWWVSVGDALKIILLWLASYKKIDISSCRTCLLGVFFIFSLLTNPIKMYKQTMNAKTNISQLLSVYPQLDMWSQNIETSQIVIIWTLSDQHFLKMILDTLIRICLISYIQTTCNMEHMKQSNVILSFPPWVWHQRKMAACECGRLVWVSSGTNRVGNVESTEDLPLLI